VHPLVGGDDHANVHPLRRRSADERERNLVLRFGEALRAGDSLGAEMVGEAALRAGMEVPAVHSRVIAPAMHRMGDLWQCGAATVSDEHLATAIAHNVLSRLFPHGLDAPPRSRERVMLAATQGELHVLGLRMVADVLEDAGFDVFYLGADVPLAALLTACDKHRPAVLGLGVTMPLNVPAFIRAIEAVCDLEHAPAIMVAGRAALPAIDQGLGVPLVEHSEHVVTVVEQLLARGRRGQAVPSALAAKLPKGAAGSAIGSGTLLTMESSFVDVAIAAAETAREAGRRSYVMEQLAYHDPLTGLWNRRAYDDRLHELYTRAAPAGSVLMIDVDRFKLVNDTYGHEAADRALIRVAQAIVRGIRPGDFGVRYGGDEFAILLPQAGVEEALAIGERLRADVARHVHDPELTISVGAAPIGATRYDTALAADQALYGAKKSGRNRIMAVGE
jgi:diguanylate cyclase (GGDEF)-like protein